MREIAGPEGPAIRRFGGAMQTAVFAAVGMALVLAGGGSSAADEAAPALDLAIAIDTSGTMERLLDAARTDVWDFAARLAAEDPERTLRVAVLTYGNFHAGEDAGWVRIEAPLTTDLDLVVSRLFAARITGDTEYVARVVRTAVEGLEWDPAGSSRRILVVLGNERATQDPQVSLEESVRIARDRGVEVRPVYCGAPRSSDVASWTRLATLAGTSLAILEPAPGGQATTPFDGEIAALGNAFAATYAKKRDAGVEAAETERTRLKVRIQDLAARRRQFVESRGGWRKPAPELSTVLLDRVREGDAPRD
ncbi:MAG TPA: vWA domain-containing protein [Candidatus Polarisedimenticolaceae bacterium]